jgi:hypothetical protein
MAPRNPVAASLIGAILGIAAMQALAAEPADKTSPPVTADSVAQEQAGTSNTQALVVGAADGVAAGVGAKVSARRIRQAQDGLANDQRMWIGSTRE